MEDDGAGTDIKPLSTKSRPKQTRGYARFKYSEEALLTAVTEIREKKIAFRLP